MPMYPTSDGAAHHSHQRCSVPRVPMQCPGNADAVHPRSRCTPPAIPLHHAACRDAVAQRYRNGAPAVLLRAGRVVLHHSSAGPELRKESSRTTHSITSQCTSGRDVAQLASRFTSPSVVSHYPRGRAAVHRVCFCTPPALTCNNTEVVHSRQRLPLHHPVSPLTPPSISPYTKSRLLPNRGACRSVAPGSPCDNCRCLGRQT